MSHSLLCWYLSLSFVSTVMYLLGQGLWNFLDEEQVSVEISLLCEMVPRFEKLYSVPSVLLGLCPS